MINKQNNIIKVSAPGKIHLLGEHSVVYGKPALLTTIDSRLYVEVSQSENLIIHCGNDEKLIKKAIKIVEKELKLKCPLKVKITIKSDIPYGRHVGSSAAVSVAVVSALIYYKSGVWDLNLFNRLAYEVEKTQHGNPSGGDNSTVCFGGLIWFQKISENEKIIKTMPFTISKNIAGNFILIDTGKPKESTGEMVSYVKSLSKRNPRVVNDFLNNQEKLVKRLLPVISNSKEEELIDIIKKGEKNLESIGVVSDHVKSVIREIEKAGGAGKICGGGGRKKGTGIILTYHKDKKIIEKIASLFNLKYNSVKLGVKGLSLENK